jgi:hypothetical protein
MSEWAACSARLGDISGGKIEAYNFGSFYFHRERTGIAEKTGFSLAGNS